MSPTAKQQVEEYYRRCQSHGRHVSAVSRVRYYLNNAAARLAAKDITLAAVIKGRIYEGKPHGLTDSDLEALGPYLKVRHK